jgi:hypothetical protein
MILVWHGSAFKLVWPHLTAFIFFHTMLSLLYRHVFIHNQYQREVFEVICIYCSR